MCDKQLGTTNAGWPIYATPSFSKIYLEYTKKRKKHRHIDWSIKELLSSLGEGEYGTKLGTTKDGGLMHKLRVQRKGIGKSYGYRVIHTVYEDQIKLVALYDKREVSDLSDKMYDDIRNNF